MPLVSNTLRGRDTHTHTHTNKKPGKRGPGLIKKYSDTIVYAPIVVRQPGNLHNYPMHAGNTH